GAQTIAINTDKQHLDHTNADTKILIGKSLTRGLGAGGDPEMGGKSAEMARKTLVKVLDGADMVFVTAGMGGGTGTGSAPVVANIAKELGAIVMGIVSTPFHVERARNIKAEEGINNLKNACDTVIVLDNDRLLSYVPSLPIGAAFSVMDQLIANTAKGISETITQSSLINLDYADVKTIMTRGGVAVMLLAESNSSNKADDVVQKAMSNPLFDVDYRGATGALVHITGGPDMSLREAEEVASALTYDLAPHADVIWGARIEDDFEGQIKVMAIMTGVQSSQIVGMGMNYQRSHQMVETTADILVRGDKRLLDIIA
ncbi:MAG: cell division protein FtsZ, partial [Methanosarcinales archaeon]|nr:cell division protein FtsZ [Methanosarcinales archaeon]